MNNILFIYNAYQIPDGWKHLKLNEKDFPTLDNNDLYVFTTTTCRHPNLSNLGLFTSKRISKGSDLCYNKGLQITSDFLKHSDYNNSNIRVVNKSSALLAHDLII